jgi:hypothetical protein
MEHKHKEHKKEGKMIDNRMVKDNHQQGIARVLQRGHDKLDYEGHFGSMKGGWKHGWSDDHHKSNKRDTFNHKGEGLTPRKA